MDRRMIATNLLKSSVYLRVCQKLENELDILAAQRLFLYLILSADDKGRGRLLIPIIKMETFMTCPSLIGKIPDEKIMEWLKIFEEDGAIKIYEVEGSLYFELTGWTYYQRGNWRPRESNIPTIKSKETTVQDNKEGPKSKDDIIRELKDRFKV